MGIYHPVHTEGGTLVGIYPFVHTEGGTLVGMAHPEVHPWERYTTWYMPPTHHGRGTPTLVCLPTPRFTVG